MRVILLLTLLGLMVTTSRTEEVAPILREMPLNVGGRSVRLSLVTFASKDFIIRVVDNAAEGDKPRFTNLASAMGGDGYVAGCNGGFFERQPFSPVGLMISGGQRAGLFDSESWMKGLLVVRNGLPSLDESGTFHDTPDITDLIQSGPWLVRNAQADSSLDNRRLARRTFICHDGRGHWAIGATADSCTLRELADLLRNADIAAVLDVHYALNLDGGPSSGLWLRRSDRDYYLPEKWPVRNYLGIFPRG